MRTKSVPWLAIIVVAGVLVRVGMLLIVSPHSGDADSFLAIARGVLSGHGFTTDLAPPYAPSFQRPPLYPLFLAAVQALAGRHETTIVVVQLVIDAAIVLAVFLATRARFGRRAALFAAALYALLPFGAGLAAQLLSESLAAAFVALAFWLGSRAHRGRTSLWLCASGAAWGCASLARPYLAPLAAVATIAAFFELPGARRTRVVHALAVSLGMVLAVGPWAARNLYWARTTGVEFVVYQPLGSRAPYTGLYTPGFLYWMRSYEEPFVWPDVMRPPLGPYVDEAERTRVAELFDRAREHDYVLDAPLDEAFRAVGAKRRHDAPLRCYVWRRISFALKFWLAPHVSCLALSMIGVGGAAAVPVPIVAACLVLSWLLTLLVVLSARAPRPRALWYPLATVLVTTAILVEVGLNESRYLMAVLPVLCMLAGRGAASLERAPTGAP